MPERSGQTVCCSGCVQAAGRPLSQEAETWPSGPRSLVTLASVVGAHWLQRERMEGGRWGRRKVGGQLSGVQEGIFEQSLSEK